MQELQASSGTQSGGSTESHKERVDTKKACRQLSLYLLQRKRGFNSTLRVQFVDVLTFELALPGLGRHL